jgi:sigma-E factor negative regulatory protein RseC
MIEEQGRVVAVNAQRAWVQTIRRSACNSCTAQKGCGQKLLNQIGSSTALQITVLNSLNVQVGDDVIIGIPEGALLKASIMLYLIPLLVMVTAAALMAQLFSAADGWVLLAALTGLGGGFWVARRLSGRRTNDLDFQPRLIRRAPPWPHLSCETQVIL